MKKFNLGYAGLAVTGITIATLLPHTDELGDNTSKAGGFVSELICVGQDLTGGMVQMPICADGPTTATTTPPSASTGG